MKRIATALAFSCLGVVAGTVAATPVIAIANRLASDGPYFPAPLVAVALVALPIGVLLFLIQTAVVAYEAKALHSMGHGLLWLGVPSGLAAGLSWYLFLASSRVSSGMLWGVGGIGVFQASVVFGCHWIEYRMGRHRSGA